MNLLIGGFASTSASCLSLVLGVPQAVATPAARRSTEQTARTLARIISRDAHKLIGRHTWSVTVTRRFCAVRVLRVYFRGKPIGDVEQGSYLLSLRTRRGVLQSVAISQTATEVGEVPEAGRWERRWQSRFVIERTSGVRSHRWKFSDFYADISQTAGGPSEPAHGAGGARECSQYRQLSGRLYAEVLLQLRNAKRGVPYSPSRVPLALCRSPEANASSSYLYAKPQR